MTFLIRSLCPTTTITTTRSRRGASKWPGPAGRPAGRPDQEARRRVVLQRSGAQPPAANCWTRKPRPVGVRRSHPHIEGDL
eukprot:9912442-Heterocapsa_arctica.AAC.1